MLAKGPHADLAGIGFRGGLGTGVAIAQRSTQRGNDDQLDWQLVSSLCSDRRASGHGLRP